MSDELSADEILARQRSEIETLYAGAPIGLCLFDTELRFLRVNERLAEMNGISVAGHLGRTLREALPELADGLETLLRSVIESGEPVIGLDVQGMTPAQPGALRHWIASYYPLKTDKGVFGLSLVVREISEEMRAEKALRESEERFRRVFEEAPIGMALVDRDFRLSKSNGAFCRLLGYTEAELATMTFAELTHPDDLAADLELATKLFRGEIPFYGIQKRFVKRGGDIIWGNVTACLIHDQEGEPKYGLGMIEDITGRVSAEQTTRTLATAIEQAAQMVVITDPEGRIRYCNPAVERTTGFSAEETIGQDAGILLNGGWRGDLETRIRTAVHTGNVWTGQVTNRKKDRSLYEAEVTVSPIRDQAGRVTTFVSLIQDVTERRSLESQLRQAQRLESVGQLAGGIAHDFNNLLTVINGYGDSLLRQLQAGDPLRKPIGQIRKAGGRAAELTRQLLTFSRKQELAQRPVGLNQVISDNRDMLQRLLGEDVETVVRLDPQLGDVMADPGQLHQVLMNLAANARDAMPRGGRLTFETRNVEVDQAHAAGHPGIAPGPFVLLTVADTGIGMDGQTMERIFDPFFTTKPEGQGTGLGLSIIYGIVRQSGGWITVSSKPGCGAHFHVYLPRITGDVPAGQSAAAEPGALSGRETLLVVEDQGAVREFIVEILSSYGYRVLDAAHGAEALELAACFEEPIHLLITDVVMPRMTGHELADELKAVRPKIKVLYISGYPKHTMARRGMMDPGEAYVAKPFSPDELAEKVRELLDSGMVAG